MKSEITRDEILAAKQQAIINAKAATEKMQLKEASDWLECANYWRARLAALNPMGY
jgi:hypothetical protein